ncbi:hypothetical protein SAMN05421595_2303 [Austwickia chelonae]|uniref:Uncharacterized protein n=1 Tax=Austwickia chelonae NBRC 105200 TaxID=1184607 RepID=K6VTI9_9MICO|nr:hypothetical protein [Austwickia chelonae]GAB78650.1 hypothetical protein AUCHE_16_00680 [Austwickia chelonae NBRC 105200]SEW34381.1 hypothetical protein SAMN05421595_2303 [Austwickia chelonae]
MLISADTKNADGEQRAAADPVFSSHLRIADFAADLSHRILTETQLGDTGPDDEYLLGYARAMSDISEALMSGDLQHGGFFFPDGDDG